MENIGDRIRKRRLELELSQLALARRANVSQGTIAQLENGRNHGTGKIYEISIFLGWRSGFAAHHGISPRAHLVSRMMDSIRIRGRNPGPRV